MIKWYVDESFAVHPDFKSHTGLILTMVQVVMKSFSRKYKLNTRRSIEAGLVSVDDKSVTFCGRCYLLNEKSTRLTRTYCIKATRVQL